MVKLRDAGADVPQLVSLYTARVRTTIEYGCQVYGGLINAAQSKVLEDVQVKCCQIILGGRSSSYSRNLVTLELERLDIRRRDLMLKFAVSCYASPDHTWWFERNPRYSVQTRTEFTRFVIPPMKQEREETFCLPFTAPE